jgi:RHS repeat-associated protein
VTGSSARTGLPLPVLSSVYNTDNQLTQWGTAGLTYDANGNMLSDGTNSFTWDARNHLASMNMGGESFQYDAFGRRVAKTVLGATTNYLYDGVKPVQELSGTTPTANLLSGGIDEAFSRTDSIGTANFLADALGSTLAQTDSSGNTFAQYTYEPFGNTTGTGGSTNSFQYTGRENDGTGIYFHRARYYNPQLQRFISEDPIGFGGGINGYAYVGNGPTNLIDPLGLSGMAGRACGAGSGGPQSQGSRLTCSAQYGQNHSIAAAFGAQNSFVGNLFGGNTFSGLVDLGQTVFGNGTPTASGIATTTLSGGGQGLPGGGAGFKGAAGQASDAIVGDLVSAGYNAVTGVGPQTLELGITASGRVASITAPLAESTVSEVVGYANLAKTAWDAGTFLYGYFVACKP